MTAVYHIPLSVYLPLDTVQLNKRFADLDEALFGLSSGLFNYADLTSAPSLPASGYYRLAIVNGVLVVYNEDGALTFNTASDIAIVWDKKTSGSDGGTFTSGAWQTRALNEIVVDSGSHLSLASNQITAAAGIYTVYALVPAVWVNYHQARLRDITNGETLLTGTAEYAWTVSPDSNLTYSIVAGQITLDDTTVLEVQHYCTSTNAGDGFGLAHSWGDEIYTLISLRRQP